MNKVKRRLGGGSLPTGTGPANPYQSECLGNACGVLEALWQASTRRQLDRHQVTKVELLKPNVVLLQSLAHGRYKH